MTTCPRCNSTDVDQTTIGTISPREFDDANRATCLACKHRGTLGDWQRIALLTTQVEVFRAAILRERTERTAL